MTRRAETIITLIGAALVALTTLGLYLLDLGDWPVGLIGLGILLASAPASPLWCAHGTTRAPAAVQRPHTL